MAVCLNGQTLIVPKKKKGSHLSQGAFAGACRTGSSPPTCSDGARNGDETGVDCGGSCPKCSDNQQCQEGLDCLSGHCNAGTCAACTADNQCPTGCLCNPIGGPGTCVRGGGSLTLAGRDCGLCPSGTGACTMFANVTVCQPRCGESFQTG